VGVEWEVIKGWGQVTSQVLQGLRNRDQGGARVIQVCLGTTGVSKLGVEIPAARGAWSDIRPWTTHGRCPGKLD
jgi:hypothetical protein